MNCKKCGKDLSKNVIHALTIPSTYRYCIEGVHHYEKSGNKVLLVDREKTNKYFEYQDDREQCEGTPVDIYYCRLCGKKYSELEIIEMFEKGENNVSA